MANTAVIQAGAGPNHMTFLLTGDGTVVGPTVTNAVILAALPAGPLRNLFSATYADQAAMRLALLAGNPGRAVIHMIVTVNDVTAEVNQVSADVDTDGATPTQPEVNFTMSDTTGQIAYCTFINQHSIAL